MFAYGLFVAGILFLVVKSSSQKTDLVTQDYYGEELKFQNRIDENKNTAALSGKLNYEIKSGVMLIYFPKDFEGKIISGTAVIYYPADKNKDITVPFSTESSSLAIKLPAVNYGLHELQISWQAGGVNYYFSHKIFI